MPNEKELIRPRRLCLRRELPEPGAHNFACGAKYLIPDTGVVQFCLRKLPVPGTKRGAILYFVFVWRGLT